MSTFDYLLLAMLLASGLVGILRGLIREAMSLATWVIALWCAARFDDQTAHLFSNTLNDPLWQLWAARLVLFIGVLFAGSVLVWIVSYFVRRSVITGTDRTLGMLFGLARGVVLAGVLVLALELGGFAAEPWWQESKLIPYAAAVAAELRDMAQLQLAEQQGVRL
ncbi:MAG: CvpA family protein [Gammaproteobacteria bacterium]|nr:CvpA family protein [Gammaproteobacteria bacterium]MDH5276810.1 CvpA family protein [Gammaproteobacteria bacterium]